MRLASLVAASKVLINYYKEMKKRDDVPVTTRQLESMTRLAQARAKACLRPVVTESDALDIIHLVNHSIFAEMVDEEGGIDLGRSRTGPSKQKQKKAFIKVLRGEMDRNNAEYIPHSAAAELYKIKINQEELRGVINDVIAELVETGELLRHKVADYDRMQYNEQTGRAETCYKLANV